ncbi:MAG: hypothetical protein IRZ16_15475 [Myxococcaceae bacterium]|nr:hypothetical protein [Myxococcaceae bacterium]
MKRLVIVWVGLGLGFLAGCKKGAEAPPPSEENAAEQEAATAGDDSEAPPPAEEKLVVTDELMNRFLDYWEKSLESTQTALKDLGEMAKEAKEKGGATGEAHAMVGSNAIAERAEAQHEALLKQYNLTEFQVGELQALVTGIGAQLLIAKQTKPDEMIAQLRKAAANAPPEEKAETERQIAELEKSFAEQKTFKEQREQYGDAAVDIALKHQDRILKIHEKAFGVRLK